MWYKWYLFLVYHFLWGLDYMHMEKTFMKQQKEVELKVDHANAYQAKNEVQR
jgi:hypothetical protein